MNTITVDASMRSRLDNLESPLQFCNESGESLRAPPRARCQFGWVSSFPPPSIIGRYPSWPRQPYRTRISPRPAVRPAADQRPKSFWPG